MAEIIEYPEKIEKMGTLINAERKAKGLKPLYMVPYLIDCATQRAGEVSEVWGHNRPNGEYFTTIIDYDIAAYENIFENLTGGSETAEEAMEAFRGSPKHWQAILNEGITHMGIGLVYNPDGYAGAKWYWCQILLDDLRGSDYKYDGQYLPGMAGLTNGKVKISVLNADTGAYFPNLSVTVRHNTTGAKHDLSGVKVTQNGSGITFGTSDDKSVIYFTTGNSPTEITDMPSGDYLLEIQSPTGYYSNNLVSLSGYYYTDFTMKNDGSEIPDITLNLTARKLSVLKTDADTGDALSGAVLELSGNTRLDEVEVSQSCKLSDDRKTITFTSGNSPVVFTKIPSGNYTLYEYSAPEGYIKAEKAVFTVGDNTITLADENKSGIIENNVLIMQNLKMPGAFENAGKLRKIVIPESVKKIGASSFAGTALKTVKIAPDCKYSANSFPENCEISFYE